MKIVSTSYTYTPEFSTPESWLQRISFYTGILDNLAHRYEVESIEQINYSGSKKQQNVQYHFLNTRSSYPYFPWKLHRFIKKLQPNVVLVNGLIFPLQILQLRWMLGKNTRILVLHRGEKPFAGIKRILQIWADKSINAYLFTSAELGKEWISNGNIRSSRKIHEVIQASSVFIKNDKELARQQLKLEAGPVYLWVGRLDANKDPLTVVGAFLQFYNIYPSAKLYMIYQTEELLEEVNEIIGRYQVNEKAISFVGKVPHKQLETWFNAADFIVSGSHHEGSGIAICEAMSCGCIPIVTNIYSFSKMTGPGRCGFLYEPGNGEELLNLLKHSVQLDLDTESKKVLKQFNEELSFKAIANKISKLVALT